MPANVIGSNRTWAIYRIAGAILYFGLIGWLTLGIAFVLAGVWAVGDLLMKLALNRRLEWGKAWPEAMLRWNYNFILWTVGMEMWPGWFGWMP